MEDEIEHKAETLGDKAEALGDKADALGEELREELAPASEGTGPILQRDYWAVLQDCPLTCPELADILRRRFTIFPPESLVVFRRADGGDGPLEVGDRLDITIRLEGDTAVGVVHTDDNSITLATVEGHPEAGRITFGAYRNGRGDVVFHIRSRARSSSSVTYAGFLAAGEAMQTNTWTDFIDRLAHAVADGVIGVIHAETERVDEERGGEPIDRPTFTAEGE